MERWPASRLVSHFIAAATGRGGPVASTGSSMRRDGRSAMHRRFWSLSSVRLHFAKLSSARPENDDKTRAESGTDSANNDKEENHEKEVHQEKID
jgi:hypothetical protein